VSSKANGHVVRAATPADLSALAHLTAAVATQPLLQRYGVTQAGLLSQLSRIVEEKDAGHRSTTSDSTAETLLLAHDPKAESLCGLARFCRRGQLGTGGYLNLLALRPGCEGRGIGTSLLHAVEQEVTAHSPVLFLLTSDFNTGAQRFYTRHGYSHAGALPEFARPGITEQLFWKRLR
jgi:ribosomal protein S18 acetylase RimI-like enzyme